VASVDPALLRRWTEAEARLYPVVLVRPELYERYIRLVRAIADELAATVEGIDALAARYEGAEELAREVAGRVGVPEGDMDFGLVAGAAFAHRYREALQDQHRDEARERIRVARERGETSVMVYETGSRGVPPYRRLEMRLADGAGIHSFVELDPETGNAVYGLEQIQLDAQTGDWVTDAQALTSRTMFADEAAWRAGVAEAGGSVP
jgi:hypothetical protein